MLVCVYHVIACFYSCYVDSSSLRLHNLPGPADSSPVVQASYVSCQCQADSLAPHTSKISCKTNSPVKRPLNPPLPYMQLPADSNKSRNNRNVIGEQVVARNAIEELVVANYPASSSCLTSNTSVRRSVIDYPMSNTSVRQSVIDYPMSSASVTPVRRSVIDRLKPTGRNCMS